MVTCCPMLMQVPFSLRPGLWSVFQMLFLPCWRCSWLLPLITFEMKWNTLRSGQVFPLFCQNAANDNKSFRCTIDTSYGRWANTPIPTSILMFLFSVFVDVSLPGVHWRFMLIVLVLEPMGWMSDHQQWLLLLLSLCHLWGIGDIAHILLQCIFFSFFIITWILISTFV